MIINGHETTASFPANEWGEHECNQHCERTGDGVIAAQDGRIYTAAIAPDLARVRDADLHAEVARRRQAKRKVRRGGPKPIIRPCQNCGADTTARQRQRGCPTCGKTMRSKATPAPI